MKKLTAEQKSSLAHEIANLLNEHGLLTDVRIYFDGKCLCADGSILEDVQASDYFKYANNDTLSMSFEGVFYEVINFYNTKLHEIVMPKFESILDRYGLYHELGEHWNLATYYHESCLNAGPPELGESNRNPIYIRIDACPPALEPIRAEWGRRQNAYGDVGSCVIGAGFRFKFQGLYYKMPPQGCWQGSCSWEASVDTIRSMLIDAGCEDISYDWGNMD